MKITVRFENITYRNPDFPFDDVNGTFEMQAISQPRGAKYFEYQSPPNANNVYMVANLRTGDGAYAFQMVLLKTDNLYTASTVFNGRGPTLPVQNTFEPQNGGTATVV